MRRSRALILGAAVLALLVVLFIGMSKPRRVDMRDMPSKSIMPDSASRQLAASLRAWLREMDAADLRTLDRTGHIAFPWAELKASDPRRAALIDDYVEQRRAAFAEKLTIRPLPSRVAIHHDPDVVEFQKTGPGNYRVVIRSKEGIRESYVQISGQ